MQEQSNLRLIYGIVLASVALFGGFIWLVLRLPSEAPGTGEPSDENVTFNNADAISRGPYEDKDVKVAVYMYADLQCTACRAQEAVLNPVMQEYQDKGVRFYWKDFPLVTIHANARAAANAAQCANEQGWFWSYRKTLYDEQPNWAKLDDPRPRFIELFDQTVTTEERKNMDKFRACMEANTYDAKVQADMDEGTANGVDRTPTYFIGRKRYFGLTPEDWKAVLDKALAGAGAATSTTQ